MRIYRLNDSVILQEIDRNQFDAYPATRLSAHINYDKEYLKISYDGRVLKELPTADVQNAGGGFIGTPQNVFTYLTAIITFVQ